MDKQELTDFLKAIPKEEFLRFGDYLKSPFFKIPNRIKKLYELIGNLYDEQGTKPLSREMISKRFYPGKKYDETQLNIRKLISDFKISFNHFLAQKEFENRKFEQKLYLLKQLRKMQMTHEYKKVLEETKKLLCGFETKDEEYYRKLLDLISEQYLFEGYHYKEYGEDLSFRISEYLDLYFIAYKLFLSQRFEAREFVLKTSIHKVPKFYGAVSKEIEGDIAYYKQHPEIYCRYLMMKMNKDTRRHDLYDEYLKYLNYVDEELKINCYGYYEDLLSHCIRMVNYGKTEFEAKIIEFAAVMERKGMFKKFGISYNDMKIIIESSIGEKKYDWAEEFVKRNIGYTEPLYRDSIYNIGLGKIFFFKKDYSSSRDHLVKVAYEDYLHYIDAKLIEARIEYEEKCIDEIFSIIDTVKKYLKSHKEIADIYRETYLAFVNFFSRLVKIYEASLNHKSNEYEIKKLKDDINSYPNLLYGDQWLKDKLDEMETGRH
jgi:hypothetical protein